MEGDGEPNPRSQGGEALSSWDKGFFAARTRVRTKRAMQTALAARQAMPAMPGKEGGRHLESSEQPTARSRRPSALVQLASRPNVASLARM